MQSALDLAVPVTGIAEAVFARGLSGQAELRAEAQKQDFEGPSGVVPMAEEDKVAFINDIREALYASKIVAYAQGFNEITEAAKVYDWKIDLAAVARIWRGGCIIRAKFLNRISDAFENGEANVSLLFAPYFKDAIETAERSWRRVVSRAITFGIPVPVFASSLEYFDGLRSPRLPAALIQGQRDYFGATPTSAPTCPVLSTRCGLSLAVRKSLRDFRETMSLAKRDPNRRGRRRAWS